MTTEHMPTPTDTEPRITDILRRMVELAREASRDRSAPGSPLSPKSAKDSDRMAKIAMQMAMNSLESPDREQPNMLETEARQAREEAEQARAEIAHERQRAERAEEFQVHQAAQDEAERRSIEEQQEVTAWARYRRQWRLLKRISLAVNSAEILRFEDIPWPTVILPNSPAMITDAEVAGFLLAGPPLREGETFRSRIKDCLLTWHPDKFSGRWIRYVVESDRARVTEGITAVTRAGNKALSDYTSRPNSMEFEEGRVPGDKRVK